MDNADELVVGVWGGSRCGAEGSKIQNASTVYAGVRHC